MTILRSYQTNKPQHPPELYSSYLYQDSRCYTHVKIKKYTARNFIVTDKCVRRNGGQQ